VKHPGELAAKTLQKCIVVYARLKKRVPTARLMGDAAGAGCIAEPPQGSAVAECSTGENWGGLGFPRPRGSPSPSG